MIAGQIHRSSVWGYAAALWSLIFAVFHVLWATGWYVGLNPETARIAFAKKPFFVYDLVVAGICVFAVPVALAVAMPWGTGLLVLRSVASVIQAVYLIGARQFPVEIRGLWELWFYLGAILFSLATWRFWHHPVPLEATEQALAADSAEACVSSNLR